MNTIIKKSVKSGVIAGVILVFFEMINFTSTMAIILEKLMNGGKAGANISPVYLAIIVGLTVFFAALRFSKSASAMEKTNYWQKIIGILCIGAISGGLISALNIILGFFLNHNIDVRHYLDALSPKVIESSLFYKSVSDAVVIYFLVCISGAVAGMIVSLILYGNNRRKLFRPTRDNPLFRLNMHTRRWLKRQKSPVWKVLLPLLIVALTIALPLKMSPYLISIITIIMIYAIMGLGINLIVGMSGQLVFGYVAFYAMGAYTFGLLTAPKPFAIGMNFWLALFFSIVVAAIGGVFIGLPTMNLRGDYLAIVTLGFAEIVRILINSNNLANYTGGPQGIKDIGQAVQPAIIQKWFGKPFDDHVWFLYLVFVIFAIVLLVARNLQYSRTGRSWESMREDETVAQACGVATNHYKLLAVVIGAGIAGVAGALYASRNTYTGPSEYNFMVSVNALSVIVIGGMGSIPGTILGAFMIKGLPEFLRDLENYRMLVFGALMIIMMVIRPEGLVPVKRRKMAVPPESVESLKKEMIQ